MTKETMIDIVRDYFDGEGFRYEYNAEGGFIRSGFGVKGPLDKVDMFCDFKSHGYLVYAICPLHCKQEHLPELIRYLTMANYALVAGNFEVDVSDGEVRFKFWVPTEGLETLSKDIVEDSIMVPCSMMSRYGDGIAALCLGFSDAQTEIEKAEKDAETDEGETDIPDEPEE